MKMRIFLILFAFSIFPPVMLPRTQHSSGGIIAMAPPPPPPLMSPYTLTVLFEGGNVPGNVAKTLSLLWEHQLLPVKEHTIKRGEILCSVYGDLPGGCAPETVRLAEKINDRPLSRQILHEGDVIKYPDINIDEDEFSERFDRRSKTQMFRLADAIENAGQVMIQMYTEREQTTITLKSFEIQIPLESSAQGEQLLTPLRKIDPTRVIPGIRSMDAKAPLYHVRVTPNRFFDDCTGNQFQLNVGTQGEEWKDVSDSPSTICPNNHTPGNTEIVLIDKVVSPHPDLQQGIHDNPLVSGNTQACRTIQNLPEEQHGTFMAGIIGSQDNTFGLIGIHPDATIKSVDWDAYSDESDLKSLAKIIEREKNNLRMQIYLFASQWTYDRDEMEIALGENRDFRLTNLLAKRIMGVRPLWIAAAGNFVTGEDPGIHHKTLYGPMNLGNLPNVVIVAAYKRVDGQVRLMEESRYSDPDIETKFVHLAAPGQQIISTSNDGHYAVGKGTSPAAAFVAGIASAMVCRFPDSYERMAENVKIRLLVTAKPVFSPNEAKRIASGILDPDLALRDPTKTWMREVGASFISIPYRRWKLSTLEMYDAETGDNVSILTEDIYRIVEVGSHSPRKWIIYKRISYDQHDDFWYIVRRLGPLVFQSNNDFSMIEQTDGATINVSQIEDLVIRNPL